MTTTTSLEERGKKTEPEGMEVNLVSLLRYLPRCNTPWCITHCQLARLIIFSRQPCFHPPWGFVNMWQKTQPHTTILNSKLLVIISCCPCIYYASGFIFQPLKTLHSSGGCQWWGHFFSRVGSKRCSVTSNWDNALSIRAACY